MTMIVLFLTSKPINKFLSLLALIYYRELNTNCLVNQIQPVAFLYSGYSREVQPVHKTQFIIFLNSWRPLSLSEFTSIVFNLKITYLSLETSNYGYINT